MSNYHTPDLRDLELYADTDKQRHYIATARKHNNLARASEELGITNRVLVGVFKRLRDMRDAAEVGAIAADSRYVLPGQKIVGMSTMVQTEDGNPQWIKTREDKEYAEAELQALRDALHETLPREKAVTPTKSKKNEDLLNLYVITDYHIGMKSWPEETGGDWDTKIAEDLLTRWFLTAIKNSPKAGTAVFSQLGDFLHWDGIEAVTPAHNNVLDADTRFQKLIRVALRVIRRVVRALLTRHDRVHLVMAEGNHDPAGSMWLREVLSIFYEDEPRVTVDNSPDPYYCYEFGKVSLFFHHGHKRNMKSIDDVFVAKFRPIFGRTEYSYGHMGHLHFDKVIETFLMHVEQHQTLAAPDAYASRGGWMSGRSAKVVTYHKEYGEVRRETITPEMV